jgi:hypothetical protein
MSGHVHQSERPTEEAFNLMLIFNLPSEILIPHAAKRLLGAFAAKLKLNSTQGYWKILELDSQA